MEAFVVVIPKDVYCVRMWLGTEHVNNVTADHTN